MKLKELGEAEAAFMSATEADETCVEAHCGLAKVYQLCGRFEEAEFAYRKALGIEPDSLAATTGLFRLSRQSGNFETTINCLKSYVNRHPDDTRIRLCLLLARVLAEKKK